MALKLDYVIRETTTNFRRNVLMSTAAILTIAVSLSLVGGALLLRQGVNNAAVQWRGGVELSIFMRSDAPQSQIDAVATELDNMAEVRTFSFVDKPAALQEARTLLASQPDVLENLSIDTIPSSFRVVPVRAESIRVVGDHFETQAGVREVSYAQDTIKRVLRVTNILQIALLVVAAVLLASATLLILNTIRVAIFARRREVSVMKLVGATNWFIRVPFMLEGLIQGLIGAAVATSVVFLTSGVLQASDIDIIRRIAPATTQTVGTGTFVLVIGALAGMLGSAAAVRRFLDT